MATINCSTLISKLTSSTKQTTPLALDDGLLQALKQNCKLDDRFITDAFHYLSIDLKKKNGMVRLKALAVIDILFQRSKLFREIVADNIKVIVNAGGFLSSLGSAASELPQSYKIEVEEAVKVLIESWDGQYSNKYPQIHTVMRYFTETLGLRMPNKQVPVLCAL